MRGEKMNCIYCGRPIEEHGAGRETDVCVAKAMGRNPEELWEIEIVAHKYSVYESTLFAPSTESAMAMAVWESLPLERRLHEYAEGAVVFCGGGSYGASSDYADGIMVEAKRWQLAICQAMLMVHATKGAK